MADVFDGKSEVYPLTVAGFLQQTQGWFLTNLLRTADCTGDIRTTLSINYTLIKKKKVPQELLPYEEMCLLFNNQINSI